MKNEFMSVLATPWGNWGVFAGDQGVVRIEFEPDTQEAVGPVPYDLAHAWEAYATGLSDSVHLPIDLTAEPTAQMIYLAIRQIPRGMTAKISELAEKCGVERQQAEKYLAVCPLPLAIPLHRVEEYDGVPETVREAIVAFETEHPRLPKPEIPWVKGK